MNKLLLCLLLFLPSCGLVDTYNKLQGAVDKLDVKVSEIDKVTDTVVSGAALFGEKAQPVIDAANNLKESVKAADKNGDNKVSGMELIAWIAAGGGTALLGLWRAFASINKVDAKRSESAGELHDKTNDLAKDVAALKAKAGV